MQLLLECFWLLVHWVLHTSLGILSTMPLAPYLLEVTPTIIMCVYCMCHMTIACISFDLGLLGMVALFLIRRNSSALVGR